MRLLKLLIGLILLRRLPFGRAGSWMVRLTVWSGLATLAKRELQKHQQTVASFQPPEPSGWTRAATEAATTFVEPSPPPEWTPPAPEPVDTGVSIGAVEESVEVTIETAEGETGGEPPVAGEEEPYVPKWVRGDGSHDCPAEYPVKAKATSMIYHVPGSFHYDVTIPDVCFATAEDAAIAGYRAPRR